MGIGLGLDLQRASFFFLDDNNTTPYSRMGMKLDGEVQTNLVFHHAPLPSSPSLTSSTPLSPSLSSASTPLHIVAICAAPPSISLRPLSNSSKVDEQEIQVWLDRFNTLSDAEFTACIRITTYTALIDRFQH